MCSPPIQMLFFVSRSIQTWFARTTCLFLLRFGDLRQIYSEPVEPDTDRTTRLFHLNKLIGLVAIVIHMEAVNAQP